ncbi:glycosyltransferase [Haloechinothrix sp. YIM 98757]|uniref:Glycosyltransferase n=2 Tax=Haloechinothrix aidingensis TaxID=2752311 RepID=A0A838AD94_9PSEU|nr:glycosyltransferase [Haloechinothrix aidingensis]
MHFTPTLHELTRTFTKPGVVNLHRLKRLYQDSHGRRTAEHADAFLTQIQDLRARGWRVVWTVQNLLPIGDPPPGRLDRHVANSVLANCDAVISHTHADAAYLRNHTAAPVVVTGWGAGMPPRPTTSQPSHVSALVEHMRATRLPILTLGHLTSYKAIPETLEAFHTHTRTAQLFLVGTSETDSINRRITELMRTCGSRVHRHPHTIPAEHVPDLYKVAAAALCPYRTDGPWAFFTKVCRPASVITASALGRVVIAPDLPAVNEITHGRPRMLYPPEQDPGPAIAATEHALSTGALTPAPEDPHPGSWVTVATTYQYLARRLLTS